MADVLVIGAGPVGSYVALKLAGLNYKVQVFEEHDEIGEPVQCSGIIGRECVQRFELPEELILREAKAAKFYCPSGNHLKMYSDTVQAFIMDRAGCDKVLATRAQKNGAQYFIGSKVIDLHVSDDIVTVEVDHGGQKENYEGKTAVIASGFGTKIPYKLGLGRIKDYVVGAQAVVDITGVDEVEVYFDQNIAPGFFAWLIPISQAKGLVGLCTYRSPGDYLKKFVSMLRKQGKVHGIYHVTFGGIPLKPLPRTYASRILVVGDAAGQVKPTTGGGVYYGLLCAEIAADVLDNALSQNDYSQKLFSNYEKAWKARLGKQLKVGYMARYLYRKLSNYQIEHIFRIIRSKDIHTSLMNSPDMHFDWHGGLMIRGLKYLGPWRSIFGWRTTN